MKRAACLASALLFIVGVIWSQAVAADSILTCTFTDGTATFYAGNGKPIEAELHKKEKTPMTVVFAGLTTDAPVFKGNMGEERLHVLKRNEEGIWLGEVPPLGGLNVWTIFPSQRVAILSKQYSMFGKPFALVSMGRCR